MKKIKFWQILVAMCIVIKLTLDFSGTESKKSNITHLDNKDAWYYTTTTWKEITIRLAYSESYGYYNYIVITDEFHKRDIVVNFPHLLAEKDYWSGYSIAVKNGIGYLHLIEVDSIKINRKFTFTLPKERYNVFEVENVLFN